MEYYQSVLYVVYKNEKMRKEIKIAGGYPKYLIVLEGPMTLLNLEKKEARLRKFEGKWITIF